MSKGATQAEKAEKCTFHEIPSSLAQPVVSLYTSQTLSSSRMVINSSRLHTLNKPGSQLFK